MKARTPRGLRSLRIAGWEDPAHHDERSTRARQPLPLGRRARTLCSHRTVRHRVAEEVYASGCATRSAWRSIPNSPRRGFGSTTWRRAPGRRSTTASLGQLRVAGLRGPCPTGPAAQRPAAVSRSRPVPGLPGQVHRRRRLRAERLVGRLQRRATCSRTAGSTELWSLARWAPSTTPPRRTGLGVAADITFGVRNGERALFYVEHQRRATAQDHWPDAATGEPAGPPTWSPRAHRAADDRAADRDPARCLDVGQRPSDAAQRVLDTRVDGIGGPVSRCRRAPPAPVPLEVPTGATAALVNITLTANAARTAEDRCRTPSYLIAWEPGTYRCPRTSNANVGS